MTRRRSTKRTTRHTARNPKRTALDTRQIVERIDAMMRELDLMRQQLTAPSKVVMASGLTQELFGAAGKGTRDEYDMALDWKRFTE